MLLETGYWAHIKKTEGEYMYQSLKEHSENTAGISAEILKDMGIGTVGYVTGILHDMGKYKKEFQDYLIDAVSGKMVKRGSVVHTFSGTKYILDHFHYDTESVDFLLAEIIAIAIASHHGLIDIDKENQENGFDHRVTKDEDYTECVCHFLDECLTESEIKVLFGEASNELESVLFRINNLSWRNKDFETGNEEMRFYMGLLERMVLSSLIEGDRYDTAHFMADIYRKKNTVNWRDLCTRIDDKISDLPMTSEINKARRKISDICAKVGEDRKGIYRLNIPTGGGKTLSSLRFAVHHAKANNMKRIIFCTPLLSILEQNASVLREFINDDSIILEHHSNVVNDVENDDIINELLVDNWEAPIIITTLVQLLNTMFSGKSSSIRRFHSLIDSIIVIDEVQTIPVKMLSMFYLTVNFLSEVCGATIVLSSATQPSLAPTKHSLVENVKDIVRYQKEIWDVFRRTDIQDGGKVGIDKFPDFVMCKLNNKKSILIICNKKDEAEYIYGGIQEKGVSCLHLSASMCMEHRRNVICRMNEALKAATKDSPIVCVSTQVIEAGVDVSFDCVIRIMAGMDSVVQAAGRCNRNGEYKELAPVFIVDLVEENLQKLQEIEREQKATRSLLFDYNEDQSAFDFDLSSNKAIESYYKKYYGALREHSMDYAIPCKELYLLDLLGINIKWGKGDKYFYHQAFKEAGKLFGVFDSETTEVVVPYGDGKRIIEELNSCSEWDIKKRIELVTKAKQYSVSVYSYQRKSMEDEGLLHWCCDNSIAYVILDGYDEDTGLQTKRKILSYMEV